MNKRWTDSQGFCVALGIFREIAAKHFQDIKLPSRIRVTDWNVEIWLGPIEPTVMKDQPGWFEPVNILTGEYIHRIPVMLMHRDDDDWIIHGKLFIAQASGKYNVSQTDTSRFKLVGGGPSLDSIVMRAKLAGYVK